MRRALGLLLLTAALSNGCGKPTNHESGMSSNAGSSGPQTTSTAQGQGAKAQQTKAQELFRAQGDTKFLYDPQRHDYVPVRDVRKQVGDLSKRFPPSERERGGCSRNAATS